MTAERPILRVAAVIALWLGLTAATVHLPIEMRSGNIVVRAEAGMDTIASKVAKAAPGMLAEISSDLPGLDVPPTIEIRLVHKSTSLPGVAPPGRGAPSWASGLAYSDLGIVTIAHSNGSNINDVLSVTSHELSHLALGAALHGRAPRWLNEGFAYLHSSDWSAARTQVLTGMAWSGNTIPLEDLERSFPAQEIEVHKAYAQSYDMVAFLARRGRYVDNKDEGDRWPFRAFLANIAGGATPEKAAMQAYGTSLRDLYGEWYENLRSRYMLIPASFFGFFVWGFAALMLILAFMRKRRLSRKTLARWDEEERARQSEGIADAGDAT